MKELTVTLPGHKIKYLEYISKYTAENISEIIEGLVYNHFIRHFEITNGQHRQKIPGKPFSGKQAERKFLDHECDYWPENSVEYQMIQSRLNILAA